MRPDDIFLVYDLSLHDGEVNHKLAGKFLLHDGNFQILEDHGLPAGLKNCTPASGASILNQLMDSQYCQVICMKDVLEGQHPDLIPDDESGFAQSPKDQTAHFDFHRLGHPVPQRLVVTNDGNAFLDGHQLSPEELARIREHVQANVASLRHTQPMPMAKSEGSWAPDADIGLSHEHSPAMNAMSLKKFEGTSPQGAWLHVNAHGTADMAEQYGDNFASKAVRALGKHLHASAEEGKVFHVRGDQFAVHFPTPEHAMVAARNLRSRLDSVPALNGTHRLTVAMGIGPTSFDSHASHLKARETRNAALARPGQGEHSIQVHPSFAGY